MVPFYARGSPSVSTRRDSGRRAPRTCRAWKAPTRQRGTRRRSTEAGKFEEEPADDSCQFNESRQVTAAESKRVDVCESAVSQ